MKEYHKEYKLTMDMIGEDIHKHKNTPKEAEEVQKEEVKAKEISKENPKK